MSEHEEQQQEPAEASDAVTEETPPPARHVDQRTMVFPDLKVLYVPVPKAGCTGIMWALARLSGLEEERFYSSYYREVSRSLTIHDLSGWPDEFVFAKLGQQERDEILNADDWFRFTVVRHPFRRLWSAWQSKILLAEPQFVEKFSSAAWFPRSVESAADVLKAFRQFLNSLREEPDLVNADVHWAPQGHLISLGQVSYSHIGRVEKLGDTIEALREHLEKLNGTKFPDIPRTNVTPLPYVDEFFDESDVQILSDVFSDDMREFDYKPPSGEALRSSIDEDWIRGVDAILPALEALRSRNERVGDLQRLFKEKREELQEKNTQVRARVGMQQERIEKQMQRLEKQKERIAHQQKLRAEEHRRNERLQTRLAAKTKEVERIKRSASWRYTRPLRGLARLPRKLAGPRRQG